MIRQFHHIGQITQLQNNSATAGENRYINPLERKIQTLQQPVLERKKKNIYWMWRFLTTLHTNANYLYLCEFKGSYKWPKVPNGPAGSSEVLKLLQRVGIWSTSLRDFLNKGTRFKHTAASLEVARNLCLIIKLLYRLSNHFI